MSTISIPAYVPPTDGVGSTGTDPNLIDQTVYQPPPPPWMPVYVTGDAARILSGVSDGMPSIAEPAAGSSSEDLVDFISRLVGHTQEREIKTAREGLKMNQQQMEALQAKAAAKLHDWVKKSMDAERHHDSMEAMKWFKRLAVPLAAVAGAAFTVATLGAGAPVAAMGIAGLSIAMGAYSVAQEVSQESGGPSLSLADAMAQGCTKLIMACDPGMSNSEARQHADLMSGLIGVVINPALVMADAKFAGQLVGGIAEEAGADQQTTTAVSGAFTMAAGIATSLVMMRATTAVGAASRLANGAANDVNEIAKVSSRLATAAGLLQGTTTVAQGGVGIANGVLTLETEADRRDAGKAQAASKRIGAGILAKQQETDQFIERLKKLATEIDDNRRLSSDVMQDAARNIGQIASNLGRQAA